MENKILETITVVNSKFRPWEAVNFSLSGDAERTAFTWTNLPNSICLAANKKYLNQAKKNENIICIITTPECYSDDVPGKAIIIVEEAAECFYALHNAGIHTFRGLSEGFVESHIGRDARVAKSSIIAPNVHIGDNVSIESGCFIGENTIIGDNVEIGPNSVIGVDGLFAKQILGKKTHIKHYGGVKIGNQCKIHTSVTIARSVNYGEFTELSHSVHVGHKSNIGHDVTVGANSTISVGAILCGRSKVGDNCWVGAGATLANMCIVKDNAKIQIGSVVITDIPQGVEMSGNFAMDHRKHMRDFLRKNR